MRNREPVHAITRTGSLLLIKELYEAGKEILFDVTAFNLHIFQDALLRPHHIRWPRQVEEALLKIRDRSRQGLFIDSAN